MAPWAVKKVTDRPVQAEVIRYAIYRGLQNKQERDKALPIALWSSR